MGHHAAAEQLPRLDDLNHRLLDLLQILGGEGLSHIKIKIEAIGNIGTNAQLRVFAVFLHRLRHHVRRRMAQHIQAVRFVNENGLNGISLRQLVRKVNQRAIHAGNHNLRIIRKELSGGGSSNLALLAGYADLNRC